ncbi:hypothetical protein Pcinc_043817 [Petrolisthes cinctipes]|uniref:Uncharacterized protein n=1 Tax=Petrolisthes cinctipes TaxID=88211 RepID=A0AAE1EHI3_PETCI|nr:hypothetical protein Pcinc_043817 [Petrolisthes cinctipes]
MGLREGKCDYVSLRCCRGSFAQYWVYKSTKNETTTRKYYHSLDYFGVEVWRGCGGGEVAAVVVVVVLVVVVVGEDVWRCSGGGGGKVEGVWSVLVFTWSAATRLKMKVTREGSSTSSSSSSSSRYENKINH